MKAGYRLTPEADRDLVQIWSNTYNNWGRKQANAYLAKLESPFSNLVDHPELGEERNEIRPGYRCLPEGSHIIFYRRNNGRIEIIRILHGRMDVEKQLIPENDRT